MVAEVSFLSGPVPATHVAAKVPLDNESLLHLARFKAYTALSRGGGDMATVRERAERMGDDVLLGEITYVWTVDVKPA